MQECLYLGNLNAKRDWGHARDFVEMMWLMLQQEEPDDFVIATGEQHSVREFVERCAEELGVVISWRGEGVEEVGVVDDVRRKASSVRREEEEDSSHITSYDSRLTDHGSRSITPGDVIIRIDPRYFRPTEVESLLGDASKAREKLGWEPRTSFQELVKEMVEHDLNEAKRDKLCNDHGFEVWVSKE